MEFCLVAGLLLVLFLGMIEVGRAMMVLGAVANAARAGARAGSVTSGTYTAITTAVQATLEPANLAGAQQVTVSVNGTPVTDDASFQDAAVPGATISVCVSIPYASASWLPTGTGIFLRSQQALAQTAVLCKEG